MIFQGNTLRGCIIHLKSLDVKSTLRITLNDLLRKNLSQYIMLLLLLSHFGRVCLCVTA